MSRWLKSRNNQILFVMMLLMALLGYRLFALTIVDGASWAQAATNLSTKSIYTVAPRGEILDKYGRILAGNKPTFAVQFDATGLDNETMNRQIIEMISMFEKNGDVYVDNLPIKLDGNGHLYYTYQKTIDEWLESEGMPAAFTAAEAFAELRRRNDVDEGLSKYEAQSELQTKHGVYPPISVKNMQFSEDLEKEGFLGRYSMPYKSLEKYLTEEEKATLAQEKLQKSYTLNFASLKTNLSAERVFRILREKFEINEETPDYQARKIMVIRNEIAALGYSSYIPAKIAKNVCETTIVNIEERSSDFMGVSVAAESLRYYPNGSAASHILGYLGQISESEKADFVTKGYRPSDMIGRTGIESVYEDTLKGTDGVQQVEVNVIGERTRYISNTEAKKGDDIYLTIDLELQKTAEESLQKALKGIQVGGKFESKWGDYPYSLKNRSPNANSGAVVALDVKTGEVLTMASYPDFDPNLFASGISSEDWKSLQSPNPRDVLSPRPLYNVALKTAVQPGSIFKLVTATAALESGLDPNRKLRDGGFIMVGNRPYKCLIWTSYHSTHGSVNLYEAIEVSCNYYFYDLASNRDYYNKKSLGLSKDMGIEKISEYARQYGLGIKTGIELGETVTEAPSAARKMAGTQALLRQDLHTRAEVYFKDEVCQDNELLKTYITEIAGWCEENPSRNETMKRMATVGVKENQIEAITDLCKYSYFNKAGWTQGDELNIAIGQGENSYTPIQMANYMATLANKGVRNQVSVVKAVGGQGALEKPPGIKMEVKDVSIFDDMLEGMRRVAQGSQGSARAVFGNFPVNVAAKTGTAQKGGWVEPEDEVEYIKRNLPRLASGIQWADVEAKMKDMMEKDPERYKTQNGTVDEALIRVSNYKLTKDKISVYKEKYKPFAWFICTAPIEDPQIAVAVFLVQGNQGGYGAPVAREIIAQYLGLDETYTDYSLNTKMVQ